jgi:predicted nucleic acid-binding protein
VIYVDTSVVLAHLLAEDRHPPASLWDEVLVASELVEYETWVRLNRATLAESHGPAARATLGRVRLITLAPVVLERAKEPFPVPVRTPDALHLATLAFLSSMAPVRLATYDDRMAAAATALDVPLFPL